ncbi:MAG: alpha/beta hydrolase [Acidimicrobiia bacterium]|nr:alpha/beta hydrolase [Acidimicrobiia bacterium]
MTATSDVPATFTARDGLEIAYLTSGEFGPTVVFVHATGFCKELCSPVIADTRQLIGDFRAVAFDQRAHGDSAAPDPPFDWWDIGHDLVELVSDARPVVGVGHSAGGAALVLAELAHPGTFSSLVLVEPIIFPPPYGRFDHNPMSAGALRRKRRFASREDAFANFVSKEAFAQWDGRAMQAYVDGGFRSERGGVVLKCTPEHEAEFFMAATDHRAWDRLDEVRTPCLVMAGEYSTTHGEPFLSALTSRFANARSEVVPESSHFVWMERPAAIAQRVADAVIEARLDD